jgi:DNA modification methylase
VVNSSEISLSAQEAELAEIEKLDHRLLQHFQARFIVQPSLTRSLVSFQANKERPVYRWYKYKEAFSASLVEYLLHKYEITEGKTLDPFAGSGTALFAASAAGIHADGIELLPIGQQIISTRQLLETGFSPEDFEALRRWSALRVWEQSEASSPLPELRITQGAYPQETKQAIEKYVAACQRENERVQAALRFALLCVLESISFTRKDGQYLRWDYRSGRRQGQKPFDKGEILSFERAICDKLDEISADLRPVTRQAELFPVESTRGEIQLFGGSCLDIMPTLPADTYNTIITSPPYCNRYDYTRTYALELALLGLGEKNIVKLRQEMLSCTVENRAKDLLRMNPQWAKAIAVASEQELLQIILRYLEQQKARGVLNNSGIPRMVKGYFDEMACVIAECARVLKPGARVFMVNDNVRYAGASISVDMILSDFAEKLGFYVENILVLPNGKGNSSQQMGEHGREALRKCVYVWRKA